MKLLKEVRSVSPTYNTIVESYDVTPTDSRDLNEIFQIRNDRWVTELTIFSKDAFNPVNEVFIYVEMFEQMTKEGADSTDQLVCRVPLSGVRPTAKLPPFVLRKDKNYRCNIHIMSATVDLNSIPLAPSFVMEMYYSEKPIDFSQLPPYRCEVPQWAFTIDDTNSTGGVISTNLQLRLRNEYEILFLGAGSLGATRIRLAYSGSGATPNRYYERNNDAIAIGNGGGKIPNTIENLRADFSNIPDTNTYTFRAVVKLVPVIP